MKKLYVVLFSLITCVSYGQFAKGTIMVGGSAGADFDSEKEKVGSTTTVTGHYTSISLEPKVGYFFIDNFAGGVGLDVGTSTFKEKDSNYKSTTTSASIAPFARYYYQNFYGQLAGKLGTGKNKSSGDGDFEESFKLSGWSIAAGYAFLLNESIAIEPQLGFESNGQKYPTDKQISSGLFIRVGIQAYLHRK